VIYVKGTVKSEYFRDMLGLVNEEKKVMITGLIAGNLSEQLLEELVTKLNFDKPKYGDCLWLSLWISYQYDWED